MNLQNLAPSFILRKHFAEKLCQSMLLVIVATSSSASFAAIEGWVAEQMPQLAQLYRDLHQSPELSLQEEQTAAKLATLLRQMGFEVTTEIGGHGVVGILKNGRGKTLLLRADMDALPVVEETGLPYASKKKMRDTRGATVGVMHACGHDIHMTNGIGALRYLASHQAEWSGTIVAMIQPAEELGAGAQAMIDAGMLARFPRPDFALAMHVDSEHPAGTIGYRAGYSQANVDSVDITMRGRGGHGAYPHRTVDPVVVAARLVLDIQTIVSREINPIEPAVITVGSIHGGTKHNIIGDVCQLQLTVRSYSPEVRSQLIEAIRRKALAAAESANAPEPEVATSEGTPSLYNEPALIEQIVPALESKLGRQNVIEVEPSMGGEDFGRLGRAGVPIVMLKLGSVNQARLDEYKREAKTPPSLHSAEYYPDPEPTIATGITAFVTCALELLPAADSPGASE